MTAQLPPVYVISLARETARREDITRRLNTLGANYQIADAVDGKALAPSQYKHRIKGHIYSLKYGRQLNPGELGCFLSHHNLWQTIAKGEDDCALVLEDDASWGDDFVDIVRRVMNCEWHWEVVLLSELFTPPAFRALCDLGGNHKLVRYDAVIASSAAYLISRTGAAKLRGYCQNIGAPLDWMLSEYWQHGAAFYSVTPPLAKHNPEESIIGDRFVEKKPTPPQRLLGSLIHKTDRLKRAIYILTHPPQKK